MPVNWSPRPTSPSTSTSRISTAIPTCWRSSSAACARSWIRKARSSRSRPSAAAAIASPSRATSNPPLRGWRTLSLQARQLAAASLALVAFLGFTGYALDRAFVDTAQNALRERLAALANGYLSGSELDRGRAFISPEPPPDTRFMIPGSGLYASVRGDGLRWDSASALGRSLPPVDFLEAGARRFEGPLPIVDARGMGNTVYAYSIGVIWESADDFPLTFSV